MKNFVKKGEFILLYFISIISLLSSANAIVLNDSSSNFLNGSFNNTYFLNNSVQLNQSFSGTFTSRVLTSNNFYLAINITMNFTNTSGNFIILLDSSADLWKSVDEGVSWTLVNDDYNDDANNQKYMTIDNNGNIYTVEDDDEIWKSTDLGISFSKINNDYDQSESSGNPIFILYANNSIYLIEKDEDIWRSDNFGLNFTVVNSTDFNKNNGDVEGVTVINNIIYLVDTDADIWTSDNNGISWRLIKDDYSGGENNDPISMTSTNSSLYIIENDDTVWKSTNLGVTWSKVNNEFGGNAKIITADTLNKLYIIEHNEDIWRSSDEGTSWVEINNTDFNQGNGDALAGVSISTASNFKYQVRSSQDLINWSEFHGPNSNQSLFFTNFSYILNIQNIKYIQYKAFFDSDSLLTTSQLINTVIGIEEDDIYPSINVFSPQNVTYNATQILINFSAFDNFNVDSLWYSNGTSNITYTVPILVILSQGSHKYIFYANDTSNNINFTAVSFSIINITNTTQNIFPDLLIISPQNITYNTTQILINISSLNASQIWWNNGTTNITYSNSIFYNFTNGSHKIYAYANNSQGNVNSSQVSFSINLSLQDSQAPNITLLHPNNNYINTNGIVPFHFLVTDNSLISRCSLIINNQIIQTQTNIDNNVEIIFTESLNYGVHNWLIECSDIYNNTASSSSRLITIILSNNFNGNTTNLSNVNLSNINNLLIEDLNFGSLTFLQNINLENGADLDSNINFSNSTVNLNSNELPMLNIPALITFYRINYTNISILMNNTICPVNICTFISYLNNTYKFNVTHFTEYKLNASFTISADNSNSQSSSGGSSGGGGSSARTTPNPEDQIPKPSDSSPQPSKDEEPLPQQENDQEPNIQQSPAEPATQFRLQLWPIVAIVSFLVLLTLYEIFIVKRRRLKNKKVISKKS